jgi:hypothetical protein
MKFNERITIFSYEEEKDELAGVKQKKRLLGHFWANCEYKDSRGVTLPQYSQTAQLHVFMRYNPQLIIKVGDLIEFRYLHHTIASVIVQDSKYFKIVAYENRG